MKRSSLLRPRRSRRYAAPVIGRRKNWVKVVIARLDPPTNAQLAALTGQPPQAVTRWLREGKLPTKYATAIEAVTGVDALRLSPELAEITRRVAKQARLMRKAAHGVSP